MAAADISKLPAAGAGSAGDSEVVGHGPNGEALYAAEWAREPTDAELGGYLPKNAPRWLRADRLQNDPRRPGRRLHRARSDPPGSHLACGGAPGGVAVPGPAAAQGRQCR